MRKFCIAFVFALLVCAGSSFAVSPDNSTDNSFDSVPSATVGDYMLDAVSYAASSAGWTDIDHEWLNQIRLALTQSNTGSIRGYLQSLDSDSGKILTKLIDIKSATDYLQNINNNGNSVVSLLKSDLKGSAILSLLNSAHVENIAKDSTISSGLLGSDNYPHLLRINDLLSWFLPRLSNWFAYDGSNPDEPYSPTLYHFVKNLSDVLASDQDMALAEANASNRQQVEQDFVSGSSGNTSLGASDFGDLSSVGGSVKDSISLNGQSSISGFTGGLSDASNAGLGWFSSSTRDALDTVSSSYSFSSPTRRAPDDTYNMAGFAENYSWLYGE